MAERVLVGEALAKGHAVGPGVVALEDPPPPSAGSPRELGPEREALRFVEHAIALAAEIEASAESLRDEAGAGEAEIFAVHAELLRDPALHERVGERIRAEALAAETAAEQVLTEVARSFDALDDPALAARAADVRDVLAQLQGRLSGRGHAWGLGDHHDTGAVLVAEELLPSLVLHARAAGVRGFVVRSGTGLSHGAILARAFGLPVVRLDDVSPLAERPGRPIAVDGTEGLVVLDPDARRVPAPAPIPARAALAVPADILVSVVDPEQLVGFDWAGVEGVGLYRSETVFLAHDDDFPSEEEQLAAYRRLFAGTDGRTVVFRTADLGADKPLAHMSFGAQDNPHLGLRAHRLYRYHPEILVTQIRAVLRAADGYPALRILYPMIESLEQWQFVQGLLRRAVTSLRDDDVPFLDRFEQGVLVETPSAALDFPRLLDVVDFASVGTNDLVQYVFAVERDARNVAHLYRPEHPVLLRLLRRLAAQARRARRPLSVCGEMAGDGALAALLVGLGVTRLCLAPAAIDDVRSRLARLGMLGCRRLAQACLAQDSMAGVRDVLGLGPVVESGPGASSSAAERWTDGGQVVDPVCGMALHAEDVRYSVVRGDIRQHFCSLRCLRSFEDGLASARGAADDGKGGRPDPS